MQSEEGIFNQKVKRQNSRQNIGLTIHRLGLNRSESDMVFEGVYFDPYASYFDEKSSNLKAVDIIFCIKCLLVKGCSFFDKYPFSEMYTSPICLGVLN